jgi:isopenicillin N synthase-like dioxygenase
MGALPVIDIARPPQAIAGEIEAACRASGFFYVVGHGVPADLSTRLEAASRSFFALPLDAKMEIEMSRGGRAWRGYFPVGGELTAGRPDRKEGLYLGVELGAEDPRVRAGVPLHGANLFPRQVPELRALVLAYLDALGGVAQTVLRGIAVSLGLEAEYFAARYTANPTVLFRIFHYPPSPPDTDEWGVGEHTDYGLLTLLAQDENAGLQVHTPTGWVDAPPVAGTFVCNLGDMLDRLTGGRYRSAAHRVVNRTGRGRLSSAYFFDPDFDAEIPPLPEHGTPIAGRRRWDGQDVHAFRGTYGDYLISKVSKVFPELRARID